MPAKSANTTKTDKTEAKTNNKKGVKVDAETAKNMKNPAKGNSKTTSKTSSKTSSKSAQKAEKSEKKTEKKTKKTEKKSDDSKTKQNRLAGVEKGDAPNKYTAYIKGNFNVSSAKKSLMSYIKDNLNSDLGIINAQYVYSAIAEFISKYVVSASGKYNGRVEEKADLVVVKLENVQRAVRESKDFGSDIHALNDSFSHGVMDYAEGFFATKKGLREFLETKVFSNSNINIPNETLNYVAYIVKHILAMLTKTACIMADCGNKKKVMIKHFKYACKVHFTGELLNLLMQRVEEIDSMFANKKDGDQEGEQEETEETETKESKGKSSGSSSKGKKSAKTEKAETENDDDKEDTKEATKEGSEKDGDKEEGEEGDEEEEDN